MKKAYLVYILLLCFYIAYPQQQPNIYDKTPLKTVLVDIEKRFEVSISYNSKIVQGKVITLQKLPETLSETLDVISEQTQLTFRKITANSYVLKKQKRPKIVERMINLDEVLISNYLTTGFLKTIDGAIEATPRDFQVLPGFVEPDVMQSVQLIPGIQSPDETSTGLNIRGGTPDQNLILWDSIKMYQYDHFFGMISSFNPYLIDNVSIYKNAAPSRYGNHISGVIDIESYSKIPKKTKVSLGTNMIYVDAYVQQPIGEKVAVIASFRRSYSDVFETVTFDEFSEQIFQNTKITDNTGTFSDVLSRTNNSFYFIDFTAKVIAELSEDTQLEVSSIASRNELDFVSQFDEINRRTDDELFIENWGVGLSWTQNWQKDLTTEVNLTATRFNLEYLGEELLSNLFDYETVKENGIFEIGLHAQATYQLNKQHRFVGGYELISNELDYTIGQQSDVIFDPDFLVTSENSQNTIHALFGEHRFSRNDWTIFSGIRGNYATELGEFFIEPSVHVTKKINAHFNANFSVERQYQFVSQITEFETQSFGLENQVWVSTDDEIPVLRSEQVSLGGNFQYDSWSVDAEVYYKKISNLTSLTRGFDIETTGLSIGESTITGLDVLVKKRFYNFTSLASYAFTQNEFQFDNLNNTNPFDGNFDIRHYLSLVQSAKFGNLELSLGWRYRTSRPYTLATGLEGDNADNIEIVYGERNGERLHPYHRLDFSAKYEIKPFKNNDLKASFGFSLLNMYNQKNILNRNYRVILNTQNAEFQLRTIDKISLGRTPNFMVRLEF
ncbi:MAG: TonB-dependent receptor [Bacteroidota bacterium]